MKLQHSFFICDEDNCTDPRRLVLRLARKIHKDLECIFCDYYKRRSFKTASDVQRHMTGVGHCMMNPDYLADFDEFYDYSAENLQLIQKYLVVGEQARARPDVVAVNVGGPAEITEEDEWVEVSGDETEPRKPERPMSGGVDGKVLVDGRLIDPRQKHNLRQFFVRRTTANHLGELVLPNSKVLGSRKYRLYYRQRFRDNLLERQHLLRVLEAKKIICANTDLMIRNDITELRGLYDRTVAHDEQRRIERIKKFEQRAETQDQEYSRIYTKRLQNTNKRHNRILSKHYRDRNLCV